MLEEKILYPMYDVKLFNQQGATEERKGKMIRDCVMKIIKKYKKYIPGIYMYIYAMDK